MAIAAVMRMAIFQRRALVIITGSGAKKRLNL